MAKLCLTSVINIFLEKQCLNKIPIKKVVISIFTIGCIFENKKKAVCVDTQTFFTKKGYFWKLQSICHFYYASFKSAVL